MSINNLVDDFLESLDPTNEDLFSYLANKGWSNGDPIYYSGPYWDQKEISAAIGSLLNAKWLSSGEQVNKFEVEFSRKFEFKSSLMVNSGSSANLVMIAALKEYFEWDDYDEIIVCACGFPTTINPILQNKLKPVFVDIDFDDLNWSLDELEKKITNRTKALFSSPVLGNPYDMDKLFEIINQYKIHYIADNCDSLGSKWKGDYLTKNSVASSCSFYPAHHITTIEGGMVSSNIPEVISLARSFAWWGRACYCVGAQNKLSNGVCGKRFSKWLQNYDREIDHKYVFSVQGYNLKPIDMLGAIGLVQLSKYDHIHRIRRQNKDKLSDIFEKIPGLRVVKEKTNAETSWFGVPIVCDDDDPKSTLKSQLVQFLEENKLQTRNYFAGNILKHPAYKGMEDPNDFPNASKVLDNVFFVGCSPVITEAMIDRIEEIVDNFVINLSN